MAESGPWPLAFLSDQSGADSFCDRLNSRYTVALLVFLAVITTTKSYVGEPVTCFCPDYFTDGQERFVNNVCWVTDTYYLPFDKHIPREEDSKTMIGYYQWVGLFLLCQAFMFYLPRGIWSGFSKKSGISVSTITNAAVQCQKKTECDARDVTMRYIIKHMSQFLKNVHRKKGYRGRCVANNSYGHNLAILYLVVKFLYIANVAGQLFILNKFLHADHHAYGFHVISSVFRGVPWSQSERFPRQTMCDFKIRLLGNVQRHTVLCALPGNLFNEKIYIFIWFWFVFLGLITTGNFIIWLYYVTSRGRRMDYIKKRLYAMGKIKKIGDEADEEKQENGDIGKIKKIGDEADEEEQEYGDIGKDLKKFVTKYLGTDGIVILHLVASCASDLIAAELICGLWKDYKENKKCFGQRNDDDSVHKEFINDTNE